MKIQPVHTSFVRALVLMLCMAWVIGCTTLGSPQVSPTIALQDNTEGRFHFSGKGAGAGMMMSGSMGAMGIAIGVAIDVGIAKDIRTALEAHDPQWLGALETYLQSRVQDDCARQGNRESAPSESLLALCSHPQLNIALTKAEFRLVNRGGSEHEDPTELSLYLTVTSGEHPQTRLELTSSGTRALAQLKRDGQTVKELLLTTR